MEKLENLLKKVRKKKVEFQFYDVDYEPYDIEYSEMVLKAIEEFNALMTGENKNE